MRGLDHQDARTLLQGGHLGIPHAAPKRRRHDKSVMLADGQGQTRITRRLLLRLPPFVQILRRHSLGASSLRLG